MGVILTEETLRVLEQRRRLEREYEDLQQDVIQVEIEALEEKVRWKGQLREEGELDLNDLQPESWKSYFR